MTFFRSTSIAVGVGGCSFAEHPDCDALGARLLWSAELDPTVLHAELIAPDGGSAGLDLNALPGWRLIAVRGAGADHIALCNGTRRLRVDIAPNMSSFGPVALRFSLDWSEDLGPKLQALQRFHAVARYSAMPNNLDRRDSRVARLLEALRIADALMDGASNHEIGIGLFGAERMASGWRVPSDALQSRVRRLIALARSMQHGGYRTLFTG